MILLTLPLFETMGNWAGTQRRYTGLEVACFHEHAINREQEDIDILFAGGSQMWSAINVPELVNLSKTAFGRPLTIVQLGASGYTPSFDLVRLTDILKRRKVKRLVLQFTRPNGRDNFPQHETSSWMRLSDWDLVASGLPFQSRAQLYGALVLGAPFVLYEFLFPFRLPACQAAIAIYGSRNEAKGYNNTEFRPHDSYAESSNVQDLIYNPTRHGLFHFAQPNLLPHEIVTYRKLARLAKEYSIPLMVLSIPVVAESKSAFIDFSAHWPSVIDANLTLVGIAPRTLFNKIGSTDVTDYFRDSGHFNVNGATLFSRAIAPALWEIYRREI